MSATSSSNHPRRARASAGRCSGRSWMRTSTSAGACRARATRGPRRSTRGAAWRRSGRSTTCSDRATRRTARWPPSPGAVVRRISVPELVAAFAELSGLDRTLDIRTWSSRRGGTPIAVEVDGHLALAGCVRDGATSQVRWLDAALIAPEVDPVATLTAVLASEFVFRAGGSVGLLPRRAASGPEAAPRRRLPDRGARHLVRVPDRPRRPDPDRPRPIGRLKRLQTGGRLRAAGSTAGPAMDRPRARSESRVAAQPFSIGTPIMLPHSVHEPS